MRCITSKSVLLAAAFTFFASQSAAQEVQFSQANTAPGYSLAMQLYSDEISQYRGVSVDTAVIDLESDGVGEVAVRLGSPQTCTNDACLTLIARYDEDEGRWLEVFRERVPSVTLERVEGEEKKRVVIDQDNVFVWTGGQYEFSEDSRAESIVWKVDVNDPDILQAIRRDHPGASNYADLSYRVGYVDLNDDGNEETVVYVNDRVFCGTIMGCPVLIYDSFDNSPFFSGDSYEHVQVTHSNRNGLRQIILHTSLGENINYWDGQQWKVGQ